MVDLPKYFDRHYFMVLKLLSDNPRRRFYQRDVARLVGISMEAANRMLKLLADEGLVRIERKGKANVYRFDHTSPLAKHVRILFNLADLNDFSLRAMRYVKRLLLVGKCAEGTDSALDPVEMLAVPRRRYERLFEEAEKYEARLGREIVIRLASEGEASEAVGIALV